MGNQILTVYIYEGLDEHAQLESATKKAKDHPNGLANVCFHKKGRRHNKKCYTLNIHQEKSED